MYKRLWACLALYEYFQMTIPLPSITHAVVWLLHYILTSCLGFGFNINFTREYYNSLDRCNVHCLMCAHVTGQQNYTY